MTDNPVRISDTTFRDAHQSLMATRLRTADMEPIAPRMDSIGFYSMEVWGGATFDAATRFLAEDPWERLRTFKRLIPNTPLSMLLRGQSLVGYRVYADDVVDAFVQRSAEVGIDIFRVFDALNDERNLERAAKAVLKSGKHLQLAICYSVTEGGRMGGPIFNLDYYLRRARRFRDMGADSICIKDMAGLLAPYDAYELVRALKEVLDIPIQLHTHYTSGMASMTALKAIEAGVDVVDACLAPLALRTSQPAVEPLVMTLRGTERDCGLDLEKLLEIGDFLESVLPRYREYLESPRVAVIDARVLSHQIPGGMASNMVAQLREAGALDKLNEVLQEIPRVRKDLGYPPLVTPMSQMVGSQAVSNVLLGRYKMVSGPVKDYVYGLYGQPPAEIDPEVAHTALRDYPRGQGRFTGRPADLLEPELEKAREAVQDISSSMDDVLIYALYPTTGLKFLRIKHGLEAAQEEAQPKAAEAGENVPQSQPAMTAAETAQVVRTGRARRYNVYVGGQVYEIEVEPATGAGAVPRPAAVPVTPSPAPRPATSPAPRPAAPAAAGNEAAIKAPMPGIVLRYVAEVGQKVRAGDPVVVLEAMKMENTLPSPIAGTVKALPVNKGATVAKDDVLAIIAP